MGIHVLFVFYISLNCKTKCKTYFILWDLLDPKEYQYTTVNGIDICPVPAPYQNGCCFVLTLKTQLLKRIKTYDVTKYELSQKDEMKQIMKCHK